MLKLGIIGTGSISHSFIKAAHLSGQYQLTAVYSRRQESAAAFAEPYGAIRLFTDLDTFLQSDMDVVYIASPNSLHYGHTKQVLAAGKHAIVEKPMVSTPAELADVIDTAHQSGTFVFEAARHFHEAALATVKDFLADKTIMGGHVPFAKYSSKMGDFLAGKTPNVFSSDFSGGALMDLGVYTIYFVTALFGAPINAHYTAQQLPNSVDLNGLGVLHYPNFYVSIYAGKNTTSNAPTEIYTTDGTLTLDACQFIHEAVFVDNQGTETDLDIQAAGDWMLEEATNFAHVITQRDTATADAWLDVARDVHTTMYHMRQSANITFKADNN